MLLLLGLFFIVIIITLCFLEKKSKQRLSFKQNVRIWSLKQSGIATVGLVLIVATGTIWYVDTNDLEVTCNKGMCFQTKLQAIHKVGLFGFSPKFFRSYVEPYAFNVEDNFMYRIEEGTCKVSKSSETSYDIYLSNGKDHHIKTLSFCNDAIRAHELISKLVACIHKETCHVVVESGYWEEIGCGLLVIFLFYVIFFLPNTEYVILDDNAGTVEILRESLMGYSLTHVITLATTITDTAFVKIHTNKKKEKTYSLELCLQGKDYSLLRQSNRVKMENMAQDLNRFVCEWNTKIKAESNFVKLKYECVICFDENVSTMLLPCAHACVCDDCSGEIHTCPLCRKEIRQRKRIFFDNS